MNYNQMIEKATELKEFKEVAGNKPQVIRQKELIIQEKEQRIQELEGMKKDVSYNLLNPKRYLNKYNLLDITKEIEQLQQDIQTERLLIEQIRNLYAVEVYDVSRIVQQAEGIVEEQRKEVEALMPEILAAQKKYFDLLQQCALMIKDGDSFRAHVAGVVNAEYKRLHDERSNGAKIIIDSSGRPQLNEPKRIGIDGYIRMDKRIEENHIERIYDYMGGISQALLNRQ